MRPVHSRPLSEKQSVESSIRQIRSACLFLNRRPPETVLNLTEMPLGWLCALFGQEGACQGRRAAPKPEVGEFIQIKDEDAEPVMYGDLRAVRRNRCEQIIFLLVFSLHCLLSHLHGP